MLYLHEQKTMTDEATIEGKKPETKYNELEKLQTKRKRLSIDTEGLEKVANTFADHAESKGNLTLIAKSNSLRRIALNKERKWLQ